MKNSTKEMIQYAIAIITLLGAFAIAIAGFITPPPGVISESVLLFFAQCLVFVASIFGITMYVSTTVKSLKRKLEGKENADAVE